MKTLKFGGGTWATKKGSILAHNDEGGNFKPLPFTYTGAGKGTRVNKEGLIEVVENDRPRIDYLDSEDGVFLLEKASTNLITHSEDFSNEAWAKSGNAVVDSNFTTSPSGKQNASKFTFDGTTNATVNRTISVTNGVAYTFSVWLKNNNLSDPSKVWIGLSTTTQGEYVTVTNEWQRFDTTHTSNGILEYPRVQTSEVGSIFAWAAMLEQSSQSSSYIPTQGTIQTRVQETASGSGNSEVFNSEQGVLFADLSALEDSTSQRWISVGSGSNANRVSILFNATNRISCSVRGSSAAIYDAFGNIGNQTQVSKAAVKYKDSDFSFFVNGFKVDSQQSGSVSFNAPLSELAFDSADGGSDFYGKTKEIGYYDEILTDEELEYMTSYRTWEAMVKELNLNIIHNE